MRWTLLLEAVVAGLMVIFIISQIIWPLIRKRPFFPMLRSAPRTAQSELAAAVEDAEVAGIRRTAKEIREGIMDDEPRGRARPRTK